MGKEDSDVDVAVATAVAASAVCAYERNLDLG